MIIVHDRESGITGITGITVSLPDQPELLAWVRGYLAGHDAGFADGRAAGHDEHHSRCEPYWEALVRQAGRVADRAGRAKDWRDAVLRGLCP